MFKNSSLADFEKALETLDDKLENICVDKIEIKAIGGFAMMYYGVRENGFTIDIDSLTKGYDEKVRNAIKETGIELEIDEDWLNTDCAMLDGFLDDLSNKIVWQNSKYNFKHIDLKLADIEGLIRSKAKAVNDGGLVPRSTDKKDLLALLENVGVSDIKALDNTQTLSFIENSYQLCYNYLKNIEKW